jgi:hypothetical protein
VRHAQGRATAQAAQNANTVRTWILRVVGYFMFFFGFRLLTTPITELGRPPVRRSSASYRTARRRSSRAPWRVLVDAAVTFGPE